MFHKVHYDDETKTMDDVLSLNFDQYKSTIVKIIVRNKNNPAWFDMFVDKLEKAGVLDMQLTYRARSQLLVLRFHRNLC